MNSSIITKAGKIWLLTWAKSRSLHIAVGSGNPEWGTDKETTDTFDSITNKITLPYSPVSAVVVTPAGGGDAFVLNSDYSVSLSNGTVTRLTGGNIEANDEVKVAYHVQPGVEPYTQTALLAELARRKAVVKGFAVAHESGEYWTATGRYNLTETPTELVLLSVEFQPDEIPNENIREVGIFADPTFEDGVDEGQLYFEPDEVDSPGTLLGLNNIPTQAKGAATKIEVVVVWGL